MPRATSDHFGRQTEESKPPSLYGLTYKRPLLYPVASVDIGRSYKGLQEFKTFNLKANKSVREQHLAFPVLNLVFPTPSPYITTARLCREGWGPSDRYPLMVGLRILGDHHLLLYLLVQSVGTETRVL